MQREIKRAATTKIENRGICIISPYVQFSWKSSVRTTTIKEIKAVESHAVTTDCNRPPTCIYSTRSKCQLTGTEANPEINWRHYLTGNAAEEKGK